MIVGIDASRANQEQRTGTEWYAWHLVRLLPSLLPQDRIRLYVREPLLADLDHMSPNVEVRVLRWLPGVLWSHLRLSWEMLWHRPDVLFVPADTVPLLHPRRTITTIHDVAFERFPELYRGRSVQRRLGWLRPLIHLAVRLATFGRYSASERDYHRWSSRQAVRTCPIILTVSEFSKQEIITTLGAHPDHIVVTHLGSPQPEYFQQVTAVQRRATLDHLGIQRPFILFVGRLELKKNIDGVLSAYRQYRQHTSQPADLVLAGQPGYGWEEVAAKNQDILSVGVVHELGWIGPEEMKIVQSSARVFLFVSRYEGFGLPGLESMSAGVPVIASTGGSLPEVLDHAADFVDPSDVQGLSAAMERMMTDNTRRQEVISAGLTWVRQFTWARTAQLTADQIRKVGDLSESP